MDHSNLAIVLILTVGFGLASILAYIARCLKLPSILGYLLAGFIIGPFSPGYVADLKIAEQLAEIGVILMLFGVGLHFKLEDLMNVKDVAIPGAAVQTFMATITTTGLLWSLGWSLTSGIIMGLSVGVASTVVLVRVLSDNHLLATKEGHIAIGWLIVEDIFTVMILILLPTIALLSQGADLSPLYVAGEVFFILAKFMILALVMFTGGHKLVDYMLIKVARLRSQELFTLAVVALMFVIATGSTLLFGTSIALGAFIAGMVIGKSSVRHQAAANALPLKDLFAVIFFLSVGMLFNPLALMQNFYLFIGVLGVILIVKPLAAYFITTLLGYSSKIAFTVAISLAQIGEFSFILGEQAMSLNILPEEGFDILVAAALISISLNPLLFHFIDYFEDYKKKAQQRFTKQSKATIEKITHLQNPFRPKVLIVGLGPIGKKIEDIVINSGFSPTVIESNIDTVSDLEEDYEILFGDASDTMILKEAGIENASFLIITIPDTHKTIAIIDAARHINADIQIIARVRYIGEIPLMEDLHVHYVCSEQEALKEFTDLVPRLMS